MSHIPPLTDDKEVLLEGKLLHLRMYLALALREIRTSMGVTQAELAERLGVKQPAVAKLESHTKDHKLEPVMRYLGALDAELVVAVKQGEDIFQVSDDEDYLVVDVPLEVDDRAAKLDCALRDYVHRAINAYSSFDVYDAHFEEDASPTPYDNHQDDLDDVVAA